MEEIISNAVLVSKMDAMKDTMLSNFETNREAHTKLFDLLDVHNGRLSKVERTWNMLVGAVLFSSIVVVPIILNAINHYVNTK